MFMSLPRVRSGGMVSGTAEILKNKSSRKSFSSASLRRLRFGGDDDANVDVDGLRAADALEAALFRERAGAWPEWTTAAPRFHQGTAYRDGQIHLANFAGTRSGEGAALVAEEFVFRPGLREWRRNSAR